MICENCNGEHEGSYGSGRFCSKVCARGFSTKHKREIINQKVSATLTGRPNPSAVGFSEEQRTLGVARSAHNRVAYVQKRIENAPWHLLKKRDIKKRLLIEQDNKCAICNIPNVWNNTPLVLQLDHIDGNKKTEHDNRRENLRLLCPNCHSQTDTFGSKNLKGESKEIHRLKSGGPKRPPRGFKYEEF